MNFALSYTLVFFFVPTLWRLESRVYQKLYRSFPEPNANQIPSRDFADTDEFHAG